MAILNSLTADFEEGELIVTDDRGGVGEIIVEWRKYNKGKNDPATTDYLWYVSDLKKSKNLSAPVKFDSNTGKPHKVLLKQVWVTAMAFIKIMEGD